MTDRSEHRPRLLILTPAADLYGSDRALLMALPAIKDRFEVVLVSAAEGPMLDQARAMGVETMVTADWALRRRGLHPAALPATSARVVRSLVTLGRLHRRRPFDLVYANTVANALLPLIGRVIPVPLVVHVREVPRDRGRMAKVLFGVVDRTASRVLCNSRFTAGLVGELVPGLADRLHAVPDGIVPLDPVEVGGSRVCAGSEDRPDGALAGDDRDDAVLDVVCVGRIHPKKGQATLIEAARLAAADGHRWHLHFWGDALAEHEALARSLRDAVDAAGLTDRVTWHGYQSDTRALYQHMDVAVVPSVLPEEFSLVTAEAQVVGLPVVATGPGGPSDILEEGRTGTIVAPEDPAALAAALIELEDADKRRAWGRAGRQRTLELFTIDRYAPAVADALVAALGDAPRRATRRRRRG